MNLDITSKDNIEKKNKFFSNLIRRDILKQSYIAKSSHIGSCYSIVEILLAIYDIFKSDIKKKKFK